LFTVTTILNTQIHSVGRIQNLNMLRLVVYIVTTWLLKG
jgi:hypothetical protein